MTERPLPTAEEYFSAEIRKVSLPNIPAIMNSYTSLLLDELAERIRTELGIAYYLDNYLDHCHANINSEVLKKLVSQLKSEIQNINPMTDTEKDRIVLTEEELKGIVTKSIFAHSEVERKEDAEKIAEVFLKSNYPNLYQ